MKVWRVVPRIDKLGNQLWSLQSDHVWPDGTRYNLWTEDRVFRNPGRAQADLINMILSNGVGSIAT